MSKTSAYNPGWEVPSLFPQYVEWVTKGKNKHHFICKVCRTNLLKPSNMRIKTLKLRVKGNNKVGKKVNTKEICIF